MNNFFLTRVKKVLVSVSAAAVVLFSSSQSVFAYDAAIHEVTDDMCWVVNNDVAGEYDSSASLFMIVQPDSEYETTRNYYTFDCTEGVFDYGDGYVETDGTMQYWFYPMNKVIFDTTEIGDVWYWRFGLQSGQYVFSEPDGMNHFYVLNASNESPFVDDGYTTGDIEVVEAGVYHPIFALYGDYDWAKENIDVLIEWANNYEWNQMDGAERVAAEKAAKEAEEADTETIEVQPEETPSNEDANLISTDSSSEEIEDGSSLDALSDEEVAQAEADAKAAENSSSLKQGLKTLLKVAPVVIILAAVLFWIKRKDSKKE